jgi:hypothetical protein
MMYLDIKETRKKHKYTYIHPSPPFDIIKNKGKIGEIKNK